MLELSDKITEQITNFKKKKMGQWMVKMFVLSLII